MAIMRDSTVIHARNGHTYEDFKEKIEKETNHVGKIPDSQDEPNKTIISPYDAVRPNNESAFMNRVRAWEKRQGFVTPLIWSSVIAIVVFHVATAAFIVASLAYRCLPMWQTMLFGVAMGHVAGFGVTAGAHRYYCHRSFKATRPLQVFLLFCFSVAGQNTVFNWVRDHRVHHKFSEGAADPHDAHRGFFFAHVGWLMMKKHPEVIRRGNQVDMSDITTDPLVRLHTKYFYVLKLLLCFVIPILVPALCWGESWWFSVSSQAFLRYMLSLNFTWSVNSFAHMFGNKPYDRSIMPAENWGVSLVAMGEGWHNYHHSFPWDYKTAELPYTLNLTTVLLDMFRRIGWAYDVKQASPELIRSVAAKKGERAKGN